MDNDYRTALAYLSAPAHDSFWKWDFESEVVVWSNGSTITFREELAVVLAKLSGQGLPAIDSVLLLIAATRAYWAEDSLALQHQIRSRASQLGDQGMSHEWSELFDRLDVVHELPEEMIRTPEAKANLAATVFEAAPRVLGIVASRIVCNILTRRTSKTPLLSANLDTRSSSASLPHELWPLRRGLEGVTQDSLRLRKQTGLDIEPKAAPLDRAVDQSTVRSLLQRLTDDHELSGLSRLARNLAAVVQLPRTINDSDELPVGGVSDLTNRGSLDRLLISELAHDDLMLATRVALNEALYLRREIQPNYPPERCHVLIDSGLRMWGVPRVFAAAVALALAASADKQTTLSAYRAAESTLIPVDLATRDGLIAHLGELEPEANPSLALREFFDHITRSETAGDAVLITTEAVVNDPEFQQSLANIEHPKFYLATVNREGGFELWLHGQRGRKRCNQLKLDLDQILNAPQSSKRGLIDSEADIHFPAIFRATPFPFRLPSPNYHHLSKDVMWSFPIRDAGSQSILVSTQSPPIAQTEYGVVILTRDHHLQVIDDRARGARQIHRNMPFGKYLTHWNSVDWQQTFAVIYQESQLAIHLLTVDLAEGTAKVEQLTSRHLMGHATKAGLRGATFDRGVLFLIFDKRVEAFDSTSLELLDSVDSERFGEWKGGRYFWGRLLRMANFPSRDSWFALSFDGSETVVEPVDLKHFSNKTMLRLFSRQGRDGAFGIDVRGDIFNFTEQIATTASTQLSPITRVLDIDPDGRRLLVQYSNNHASTGLCPVLIDAESGARSTVARGQTLAEVDVYRLHSGPHSMRRFIRIAIQNQSLVLFSKRNNAWTFVARQDRIVMQESRDKEPTKYSRNFEAPGKSNPANLLSVARWADGSRAWLDARGILHLQSSNESIPEISLVLTPSGVAIWTSDGRMNGTHYFIDGKDTISPAEIITTILEPFAAVLSQKSPTEV